MTPWTFVHATDLHIGSPKSFRFAPACNENWKTARKQIVELNPDLLLVGGDVARDGTLHRYELDAVKADFDALPFPVHVVPGNMDTGNKFTDVNSPPKDGRAGDVELNLRSEHLAQWESVFGPSWWSFVHKNVRFSGCCDLVAGSGLPEEKDFWDWMEAQKALPRAEHHVWILHYAVFIDDLHEPNVDITDPKRYLDWYFCVDEPMRSRLLEVFKATGTDIVISGHIHCRKHNVAEGIRFDIGPSTAFSQWGDRWPDGDATLGFLRYDVSDRGIDCTFIPLRARSTAQSYGPGGHPAPDRRDYSIAWEK